MKDQLIAVMEALRLVRAELATHGNRPVTNAPRTLARIEAIMNETRVAEAIDRLYPNVESPSIAPEMLATADAR